MTLRIGKLSVELSYPLVAIMTAVIILDRSMSVIVCFAAAIMHESGHIIALRRCGAMPERVKLTLFDIAIIDQKKYTRSYGQELVVVLAGVTVNFAMALLFLIFYRITEVETLMLLCSANLGLGIFNSLPVDSLDGGQALLIILCRFLSPRTASIVLDVISFIILIPAACIGFFVLLNSQYNFTLLITALYLIALILLKHKKG